MPTDTNKEKPKTTAQIAKAYFGAIAERDLDAAVALWKPGSRDHIHGIADMRSAAEIKGFFCVSHSMNSPRPTRRRSASVSGRVATT